jgi:hypothetical protein
MGSHRRCNSHAGCHVRDAWDVTTRPLSPVFDGREGELAPLACAIGAWPYTHLGGADGPASGSPEMSTASGTAAVAAKRSASAGP